MSVGRNLQEMENVVTKGAAPAEPMQKLDGLTPGQTGAWEDLGGPTPENYRPDDNSAALATPGKTLAQVKDVVNAKAAAADSRLDTMKEESEEKEEDDLIGEVEEYVEEEEEEEVEEEIDIEEDVQALLAGEELSEEFQEKARTIFEAAIRAKVSDIKEQLQQEYETALVEQLQVVKEEIESRVDSYLEYVADEWVQENALAVEHGLKTEMTESFLAGMKSLFEDHYVTVPEDRYDVIESMVDKLDEMESKLNEQIQKNVALNKRLAESVADVIFADVAEGLALSQKDKLASLAENVEFESEADYREKLVTLRESYFPSNAGTQKSNSDYIAEETNVQTQIQVSGSMASYLDALSRVSKK